MTQTFRSFTALPFPKLDLHATPNGDKTGLLLQTAAQHDTACYSTAQHCGTARPCTRQCRTTLQRCFAQSKETAHETGGASPTDILGERETCESMDDQLVISAVAAHRSLYDPSHIKYKDVELRNAIWIKIAGDLKMEGWYRLQAQVLSASLV